MFMIIVFWLGTDMADPRDFFFFRARFASFHTHASLLIFLFCFRILFHSCCSHVQVFGKTLVHEFHIPNSHTEWYLFFTHGATTRAHFVSGAKKLKFLCTSKPEPLN